MSVQELRTRIFKKSTVDVLKFLTAVSDAARRLPQDYKATEDFFEFVSILFDRLFGEKTTGRMELPEGWEKAETGGWLRVLCQPPLSFSLQLSSLSLSYWDLRQFDPKRVDENTSNLLSALLKTLSMNSDMMDVVTQRTRMFLMPIELLPIRLTHWAANWKWYPFIQNCNSSHEYLTRWTAKAINTSSVEGMISLSPFHYFLVCLLRYPCLAVDMFSTMAPTRSGIRVPTCPYTVLLRRYISDLVPHGTAVKEDGLLFIYLASELWLSGSLIIRRDHSLFERDIHSNRFGTSLAGTLTSSSTHPLAIDVVFIENSQPTWTFSELQCTYYFIWHNLSDPALKMIIEEKSRTRLSVAIREDRTSAVTSVALPPGLAFFQQPLFDTLRAIFQSGKRETFLYAVELWLLYIQPWSLNEQAPTPYTSAWRYYVAANFHYYSTLLISFLRHISAVNILPRDEHGAQYVNCLLKVLKVFSGVLISDINSLLEATLIEYSNCNRMHPSNGFTPARLTSGGSTGTPTISGNTPDCTPRTPTTVSTLEVALVVKQHQHLFPDDRIDSLSHNGFTDLLSGQAFADRIIGTLRTLDATVEVNWIWDIAVKVVQAAADAGVSPSQAAEATYSKPNIQLLIQFVGQFTQHSWESESVAVDELEKPPGKQEIECVAFFAIWFSRFLNSQWKLPRNENSTHHSWSELWALAEKNKEMSQAQYMLYCCRVNLRFLSSYSVVIVLQVLLSLWIGYRALLHGVQLVVALYFLQMFMPPIAFKANSSVVEHKGDKEIDEDTGELSAEFRDKVVRGQAVINRASIRYRGDVLDLPFFSSESALLASWFVSLSKKLNHDYNLPKDRRSLQMSTFEILAFGFQNMRHKNIFLHISDSFRFNFRILADINVVPAAVIIVAGVLYLTNLLGVTGITVAALSAALFHFIAPCL